MFEKRGLRNDLGCTDCFGFDVSELVTASETPFAEETTFNVPSGLVLGFGDYLFDDVLGVQVFG